MNSRIAERTVPRLRLTPADQGRHLTREEFETADWQEGFRYELIRGRLEVSPVPNLPHERLRKRVDRQFDRYMEARPDIVNQVAGPARLIIPEPSAAVSVPEPDLVCYHNFPLDLPEDDMTWEHGTPILVIEIISESNAPKDLERNPDLYLQVDTIREYWIIDPRDESHERPSMTVYRRRGQRWQKPIEVEAGGVYTTRLLPGFVLNLSRREDG